MRFFFFPPFFFRWIPYIVTTADFVTDIGAGMTVRFFPLFFISEYGISPAALCCIFCVYPLCVSLAMSGCQKLSNYTGRAQASFVFQCGGILMLLLMTCVNHLPTLIVIFMIRGQLQNAACPVDRSILMDYIPSRHRGKWSSIATLTNMTWSGSAVIGGYLVDQHSYRYIKKKNRFLFRYTFIITAAVYTLGVLCYAPLVRQPDFLVPLPWS